MKKRFSEEQIIGEKAVFAGRILSSAPDGFYPVFTDGSCCAMI